MTHKAVEQTVRAHEHQMHKSQSILPSMGSVAQASAFGAAFGGLTSGVLETARVRQGEITSDKAIENVIKSSAQSGMSMAVATVAAQMVRSNPVFALIALGAAGISAVFVLSGASKNQKKTGARTAKDGNRPNGQPAEGVESSSASAPESPS